MARTREQERDYGRGRRAKERARAGSVTRGGGIPMAALAPEVLQMAEQGMTVAQIAKAIGRSDRYVRKLKQYAREHQPGSVYIEVPDPKTIEDMDPEHQEMMEWSADAFELFYVEFSPYDYLPRHLKEAVADALRDPRTMVNIPPGHAKSEVFSVWFPIWLVCRDRNVQILLMSKTEQLATKFANEISANLMTNQRLISAFGRFKPETMDWPWQPLSGRLMVAGRDRLYESGDLTFQIRGGKQQILGMRMHWVILDDVTDESTSDSEVERTKLEKRVDGEALSRLLPGGHAVCIGQRVHMFDIYNHLEQKKHRRGERAGENVWTVTKMPAVIRWPTDDTEAEVLWPEEWSFDELMDRYADQGETMFETMYQQNPMPLGQRIVRPEWIYGDGEYRGCLDLERVAYAPFKDWGTLPVARVVSIDPSPKQYTGVCVADVVKTGERFLASVLEIGHEKGMGLRDLVKEIERVLVQYAPVDYLIFEESTFSHWLYEDPYFQVLRNRVRVVPHITSAKTKGDPELGIRSLAIEFEQGLIRLPYGSPESKLMVDSFLEEELFTFPQGRVDDRLDALWFIKARWRSLTPTRSLPTSVAGMRPKKGDVWHRKYQRKITREDLRRGRAKPS